MFSAFLFSSKEEKKEEKKDNMKSHDGRGEEARKNTTPSRG